MPVAVVLTPFHTHAFDELESLTYIQRQIVRKREGERDIDRRGGTETQTETGRGSKTTTGRETEKERERVRER